MTLQHTAPMDFARSNGDRSRSSEFETERWRYLVAVPAMYIVASYVLFKKLLYKLILGKKARPRINSIFFDAISATGRKVRDGAAGFRALDAVYNFKSGVGGNALLRAADNYWLRMMNAQAVRNRLVIVKRELRQLIIERHKTLGGERPVRILSIAAGSAQAVIEVMAELRVQGIPCEALLLDSSPEALDYALQLAKQHGVSGNIQSIRANLVRKFGKPNESIVEFDKKLDGFMPDVVEMAGLIDYLQDPAIVALLQMVRGLLPQGGHLITCHIHRNPESFFLLFVVNWWMRYRSRRELAQLLERGGFANYALYTEPHEIHTVAVATVT